MIEILLHWGMTPEAAQIALSDLSFWFGFATGITCAGAFWGMLRLI